MREESVKRVRASFLLSTVPATLLFSLVCGQLELYGQVANQNGPLGESPGQVQPALTQVPPAPTTVDPPAPARSFPGDQPPIESRPAHTTPPVPAPVSPAPAEAVIPQPAIPPPPAASDAEPDFKITSDVELVLLDVSVKNPKGGFVSGLKQSDFKIYENRMPQEIKVFNAQDTPVTVGLVIDNSGSVRPKKPEIVTAALTFVTQSNPHDEVFIVNFNDRVAMGLPDGIDFSGDRNLLRQALLTNPAQGRTSLYDALKTALSHLDKGRLDKKTLVVVADGGDNMSETTKEEVLSLVENSLATIYTVGIFNQLDKDKNPGFLRRLAEVTGGEYFEPEQLSNLVGVCEKIAHDIRNRYTIGYTPARVVKETGKNRKIRVFATAPEDGRLLRVRTRTEYSRAPLDNRSRAQR